MAAGHKTIFTIFRQASELRTIRDQKIEPIRSNPDRFIILPALSPLVSENLKYDFDNLSFLLESEYSQCLQDLYVAENSFQNVAWLFRARHDFHVQNVQPLLNKAGIGKDKAEYTVAEIKAVLGPMEITRLTVHTDNLINYLDSTIVSLQKASDQLSIALKKIHPDERVIGIQYEPEEK